MQPAQQQPTDRGTADVDSAKREMRTVLLQRRRRRATPDADAQRSANADHLLRTTAGTPLICAFVPLPSEPLPLDILGRLTDRGCRVLVPVITGLSPLDWIDFSAARSAGVAGTRGPLGIVQFEGPRLGAAAAVGARMLVIPALAVDRNGFRLGRGGGHYDRTLALVNELATVAPTVVAVLYDDEVVPDVPHNDLDRPVDAVITPSRGVLRLR